MHQALIVEKNGSDNIDIKEYNKEEELRDIVCENVSLLEHHSIFKSPLICIGRETDKRDITALNSEGVPVIIETKLTHNQDLRDVIAQIFDYASRLNQMTFTDLNERTKSFFSSPKYNGKYKNLDLLKAFMQFQKNISDDEHLYDEKGFIIEINKNLKDGTFILLLVVDSIREDVLRSIRFFNSKLETLRIEVIEVSKYQNDKITLFSSNHISRDIDKSKQKRQVKKTYEDLYENWPENFKKSIDIFKVTLESNGFEFFMQQRGLPIKYNNQPIMFLRQDHIQIAKPELIKNGYEDIANELLDLIKTMFDNAEKTLIKFKLTDQNQDITFEKMESFAKKVIAICVDHFNGGV